MIGARAPVRRAVIASVPVALVAAGLIVDSSDALATFRFAVRRAAADAPSARVIAEQERARAVPTVSLVLRPRDLHSRLRGLLTNTMEHGPDWERPGWVSFFDEGRLLHSAPAGVRIHGGSSREQARPQGFRLYFRREYGAREIPGAVAFGDRHAHPLRRLVVHNDYRDRSDGRRWQFMNPLAYDIARAAGALAPPARPARFFLNGVFQGVYVLTEHLHPRDYFEAHPGYRMRATHEEINALTPQVRAIRPLRMATIRPLVDVDNLTRWFLAVVFCATGDAYQEPGVFRDPTRRDAQWFWVNWDMDGSFRQVDLDSFPALLSRTGQRRARRASDPRPYILTTLLDQDPEYRAYFMRVWADVMNHALTPEFLDERFRHYARLAETLGVEDRDFLVPLARFLRERPHHAWRSAEAWLATGSVPVTVSPGGSAVHVDGRAIGREWHGRYFSGMPLTLDVPADAARLWRHWLVNGAVVAERRVTLQADRPLQIAAVWADLTPATPSTP